MRERLMFYRYVQVLRSEQINLLPAIAFVNELRFAQKMQCREERTVEQNTRRSYP